jgi:hypothetical protein
MISRSLVRLRKLKIVRGSYARVRIKSHIELAVTSAQVRKQLVEEEAAAARLGEIAAHDVSPSALIHSGMELEEFQ